MINRTRLCRPCAWLIALALLAGATTAGAHGQGLSTADFALHDDGTLEGVLIFAAADVPLDDASARRIAVDGVRVTADDEPCAGRFVSVRAVEADGVRCEARFECGRHPAELGIALPFVGGLTPGHRIVTRIRAGDRTMDAMLSQTRRSVVLATGAPRPFRAWRFGVPIALGVVIALALVVVRRRRQPH